MQIKKAKKVSCVKRDIELATKTEKKLEHREHT